MATTSSGLTSNLSIFLGALLTLTSIACSAQSRFGVNVPLVDPWDREQVAHLWRAYGSRPTTSDRNLSSGWTGSLASCRVGDLSAAYRELLGRQVNAYRSLAGLRQLMLADQPTHDLAQAAAVNNAASVILDHFPPATSRCYSAAAKEGAATSLLAFAPWLNPNADGFMDDAGAINYFVGHRKWLLSGEFSELGIGKTDKTDPNSWATENGEWSAYLLLRAMNFYEPVLVAWPSPGYFPSTWIPLSSHRWSAKCSACDMRNVSVSVKIGSEVIPVTLEAVAPFADYYDQVVFVVPANLMARIAGRAGTVVGYGNNLPETTAPDLPVDVLITGVKTKSGAPAADIAYRTILMNPSRSPGKSFPVVRHDGVYTYPAEDGWGLHLVHGKAGTLNGAWFTFDEAGNPTWYEIGDGRWADTSTFAAKLFRYSNVNSVLQKTLSGGVNISFAGNGNATFEYRLGAATSFTSKPVSRLTTGPESYTFRSFNYSDRWQLASGSTALPSGLS